MGVEDAYLAVEALGRLHTVWWGTAEILRSDCVSKVHRVDREAFSLFPGAVRQHWPAVKAKSCGDSWSGWTYDIPYHLEVNMERLLEHAWAMMRATWEDDPLRPVQPLVAICHGDPRAENFYFFTDDEGKRAVGLLDWQLNMAQDISSDISYFLVSSFSDEDLLKYTDQLVDHYFGYTNSILEANGKSVIEKDAFMFSLRVGLVFIVLKTIVTLGGVAAASIHTLQVQNLMMHNGCWLYKHWDCASAMDLTLDYFVERNSIGIRQSPSETDHLLEAKSVATNAAPAASGS